MKSRFKHLLFILSFYTSKHSIITNVYSPKINFRYQINKMYAFNEKPKIDTFKRFTDYIERMFQKMKIKNDLQCDRFF